VQPLTRREEATLRTLFALHDRTGRGFVRVQDVLSNCRDMLSPAEVEVWVQQVW
jgi:hypothetical protein